MPKTRPKREFRAWDGEGVTNPITNQHFLIMLANSDGDMITRQETDAEGHTRQGLTSVECLDFLTRRRSKKIEIWFAFSYDVNMILGDMGRKHLQELWDTGTVRWLGYSIKYIPRKFFGVTGRRGSFQSTDVFSFFQQSFIKSLKKWSVDGYEQIEAGKSARANFSEWDMEAIADYNSHEMGLLVCLADKLREKLEERCGLRLKSWHGPGAVASTWLHEHGARSYFPQGKLPLAIAHAYFGGRTDISSVGEIVTYRSDLASAYPAALSRCVDLSSATWDYAPTRINDEWGLYHVTWNCEARNSFGPLPFRLDDGTILYPPRGEGWYWGVELLAAERAFPGTIRRINLRGLSVHPAERTMPLRGAIERAYRTRAAWKNSGEIAHEALKLVLNSLYGKLAMAPTEADRAKKIEPPYRNVAWAGWITAWTRAQVSTVIESVGAENVVSIATDGILLRVPNPLARTGNALGEWQDEGVGSSLIVCPGLYAHLDGDGDISVVKQRGLPGGLNYGYVLRDWGCLSQLNAPGPDSHSATSTRFNGMGVVLKTHAPRNQFVEQVRTLSNVTRVGTSKRIPAREEGVGWMEFPLALREIPAKANQFSAPYKRLEISDDDQEEYEDG